MEEKISVEELKELGLDCAAEGLHKEKEFDRKCLIAYENFRFVTPEQFNKHNEKLKENTFKMEGKKGSNLYHVYDKLQFISLKDYKQIPPRQALAKLREAKTFKCFDTFEVCKIESVREYKDPIIFGVINDCPDKFFVCQWDNDIKIEDIINEREG